jgi:GMP synthase-like glutamine amidotransferase
MLADNALAQQAYRVGRTLALQFHPEVNESMVSRWSKGGADELVKHGVSPDELMAQTRAEVGRTFVESGTLVDWFCAEFAGS